MGVLQDSMHPPPLFWSVHASLAPGLGAVQRLTSLAVDLPGRSDIGPDAPLPFAALKVGFSHSQLFLLFCFHFWFKRKMPGHGLASGLHGWEPSVFIGDVRQLTSIEKPQGGGRALGSLGGHPSLLPPSPSISQDENGSVQVKKDLCRHFTCP